MNFPINLVLASASPRRQQLLNDAGFQFEIVLKEVDESYPPHLTGAQVALYLASKKASAYDTEVAGGKTIITADTIVCIGDSILGKPANANEAESMLVTLSGKTHKVITAVCIRNQKNTDCFHVSTAVTFKELTEKEISWYINHFKPYDKAGAYGIQEWIGLIAISRIEGSYHNVVGLPVKEVYEKLMALSEPARQ
jgi:septum formation protein